MVTELNPDALSIAAELDAERANGTVRGYASSTGFGYSPLLINILGRFMAYLSS